MEIMSVVSSLQNKSSAGYDSIPADIMKSYILHIAEPMAKLINCSIRTGIFPDKFKIAKVCPVFKSGEKDHFENYRPISFFQVFLKFLRK